MRNLRQYDTMYIPSFRAMAFIACCVLTILSISSTNAQIIGSGDLFLESTGGGAEEVAYAVQQTTDGGYFIAGYTASFGGYTDVLLLKLNSTGATEWMRTAGGEQGDLARTGQQTSDGGYIVAGYTGSYIPAAEDIYLLKYDAVGTLEWRRNTGGSDSDHAHALQQTSDDGYIIAGWTKSFGAGDADAFLLKYDSYGILSWSVTAGGGGSDIISAIQQTADGGYIAAGKTESFGAGGSDVFLIKYESTGAISWAKTAGGSGDDFARSVRQTADDGYIVAGFTTSYGAGANDVLLIKFDSAGVVEWARTAGGANHEYGYSMQITYDGGYVVAGHTYSYDEGDRNGFLLKYDSSGALSWAWSIGGSIWEYIFSVDQTADGGYVISGMEEVFYDINDQALIVKTNAQGFIPQCTAFSAVTPSESSPSLSVGTPIVTTTSPSTPSNTPPVINGSPSAPMNLYCYRPGSIFSDDFESGDTSAWSETMQ
jgi:uncharacterized delta-60 repeat protein